MIFHNYGFYNLVEAMNFWFFFYFFWKWCWIRGNKNKMKNS